MNYKHAILGMGVGLAISGSAMADTIVLTEPKVKTIVTEAGYIEPIVVKHQGKLWRVKSTDESGSEVTLFVDEQGTILGASEVIEIHEVELGHSVQLPITEAGVTQILGAAGFHNVHDVELKDTYWKAEADDITGEDFEIHVALETGEIIHIEDD